MCRGQVAIQKLLLRCQDKSEIRSERVDRRSPSQLRTAASFFSAPIVLIVVLLFASNSASAQQQIVNVDSIPPGTPPSSIVELDLSYSTDPVDDTLVGLGLRLHWDSESLSFGGLTDVLPAGLKALGQPEADVLDLDGNPSTDTFVHLAWADLDGRWPEMGIGQTGLAKVIFQTAPDFDGSTQVVVSASATSVGYAFRPQPVLFADDFESGDMTAWSAITGSISAARAETPAGAGPPMTELLVDLAGTLRSLATFDFPLLDVDDDGDSDTASDGLLILRYLFGFTGEPLIDGALSPDANRLTAGEIEAYLSSIEPALDIDLDGRLNALTDGILVMRFLDGVRGEALTENAVEPDGSRIDPSQIEEFLTALSDPFGLGDSDGDGVADIDELIGFNILIDLDGLGICCLTGRTVSSDPFRVDTDGDGLDDLRERLLRTDPRHADTDLDGLPDLIELERYASAPGSVDTDGDSRGPTGAGIPNPLFFDGNEVMIHGTSPTLGDTDGDARSDYEEANQNATPPLVADVPRLAVELVGEVDVLLEYTSTMTTETRNLESTLVGQTDTSGQSRTDSTSSRQTIGASATVTAGVEAGFPGGVTASASVSATVSGEYSEEDTTSFTEDSSVAVQNQFQASQEVAISESETVTGGSLSTGIRIRNLGDVAFTLSDLSVTALLRDVRDRQSFRTIATLVPPIPTDGFTLGPFSGSTGVLQVEDTEINTGLATSLLADPAGLYLDVGTFSLEDAEGRNFVFLSEVTNERTALVTIDFGNGEVERYRVATLVERRPDGTGAGITMEKILNDILDIPFGVERREDSNDPLFPDGVSLLTRVRDVETDLDMDPNAYQNSFWAVLSDDPAITGVADEEFTTDFEDLTLFSGDALSMVYVTDDDWDGLFLREEFLYGTTDSPRDFDGDGTITAEEKARTLDFDEDGLSDFVEVRTGWEIQVDGLVPRLVFPDPTRRDTDRIDLETGAPGGDLLTDLEEFRGRDGCGPHSPTDPSQPDPACGGASDTQDATDPTSSDTDQDGLDDSVDDDPLNVLNLPPTIGISVTSFSANTGVLHLMGSITDPTDPIDEAIIDWGDGMFTCLANDVDDCSAPFITVVINAVDFDDVDVTHQYLESNPSPGFTVTVTAADDRQPPGTPAVAEPLQLGPFRPVLANDDVARYWMFDGELCNYAGGGFDGTVTIDSATITVPTSDRFGGGGDARCFKQTSGSGGTFIEMDDISATGPQLTLAAWILPSSRGGDELKGNIVGRFDYARLIYEEDGEGDSKVTFRLSDEVAIQDPTTPMIVDLADISHCNNQQPLSSWTFYAATLAYDGSDSTLRLYRGTGGQTILTEVGSRIVPGVEFPHPSSTRDWQIGGLASDPGQCDSNAGLDCYDGRLDDVRIYDRALSQGELESLLIENPGAIDPSPSCPR